jgi:hypothetical protein
MVCLFVLPGGVHVQKGNQTSQKGLQRSCNDRFAHHINSVASSKEILARSLHTFAESLALYPEYHLNIVNTTILLLDILALHPSMSIDLSSHPMGCSHESLLTRNIDCTMFYHRQRSISYAGFQR